MKLNHDCIRHILLSTEKLPYNHYFNKSTLLSELSKFNKEDILYSVLKLDEAGYINVSIAKVDGMPIHDLRLKSITWEGHKFLDTIRDEKVWSETKKILSKVSSSSISFASNIASQVLTNLILHSMNL